MALSPITPIPVNWENCLVDLQPTSQFGADHDTAMINTTMLLQASAEEEATFVLPIAGEAEQAPLMRVVAYTPEEAHQFEEQTDFAAIEAEFGAALTASPEAKAVIEAAKAESPTALRVKVKVKKGDQLVRFFYPQEVPQKEDGSFEFRILAPLASFVLNPSGGNVSFAVAMPRVAGKAVTIAAATSENPPGSAATELTERPVLAQRQLVGHYLSADPLYVIRYSYA
jgi:hypothetical protein